MSPLGKVLAGPVFDREAILTVDLDLAEVTRAKYDFDVTGHYARPDVFRLLVDERPAAAVSFRRDAPASGERAAESPPRGDACS